MAQKKGEIRRRSPQIPLHFLFGDKSASICLKNLFGQQNKGKGKTAKTIKCQNQKNGERSLVEERIRDNGVGGFARLAQIYGRKRDRMTLLTTFFLFPLVRWHGKRWSDRLDGRERIMWHCFRI